MSVRPDVKGTPSPATEDVTLAERLAFERLLGDLSAQFANLPADRVLDEIAGALRRLIDFLGFIRSGFGEVVSADGRFEVRCSAVRHGIDPTLLGPGPTAALVFRRAAARARYLVISETSWTISACPRCACVKSSVYDLIGKLARHDEAQRKAGSARGRAEMRFYFTTERQENAHASIDASNRYRSPAADRFV